MRISKIVFCSLLFFTNFVFLSAFAFIKEKVPNYKEIVVYVSENDWGASVNKIVVNVGKNITEQKFEDAKDEFEVYISLIKKTRREFKEIYLSDGKGERCSGDSKFITVIFDCFPFLEDSDPFTHTILNNVSDVYNYRLINEKLDIKITKVSAFINPTAANFSYDSKTFDEYNMSYLYYDTPQKKEGTPLIIWFHSIAEGGKNPYLPIFGCKAINLATPEIQQYFKDGACVLAPLCPTTWLETTSLDPTGNRIWAPVNVEGLLKTYLNPVLNVFNAITNMPQPMSNNSTPVATTSYYTQNVMQVILEYLSERPYIDTNKIYVGGCSAGGYMTMNMILEYPDFFAAAFPTCAPYPDSKISDKQIIKLKNFPLWFTQALNDKVVKPDSNCLAIYDRLIQAKATNVHLSLYDNVLDTTELYFNEDGTPYEYSGHYSWTYLLNNQCQEQGLLLFEWLSRQSK